MEKNHIKIFHIFMNLRSSDNAEMVARTTVTVKLKGQKKLIF